MDGGIPRFGGSLVQWAAAGARIAESNAGARQEPAIVNQPAARNSAMSTFVRRSHLMVSVLDGEAVESAWSWNADAIILDLGADARQRPAARRALADAAREVAKGGAETFILTNADSAYADARAAAVPELSGVAYAGAESGEEMERLDAALAEIEREGGLPLGSLSAIVLLNSGAGVWNIREIISASPRVSSVGLDEAGLRRDLRIAASADFDPFEYAKGRVVIEARARKIHPIGMGHPFGAPPADGFGDAEMARLALRSKNLGFAGAICPRPSWVSHCNRAFAPAEDKLEFYRETRRLFAEGVARGSAAVPYPGTTMMIDVPVDENARLNLELRELVAEREAQKSAARANLRLETRTPTS